MLGDRDVGVYSEAVRISEVWYFIPAAIVTSVFPVIVESKKISEEIYYERLQKLFTLMTWLGISVAVIMTLTSKLIVFILFGKEYIEAATVLAIYILGGLFMCLGTTSGIWFSVENLQKYSFYRTLNGAIVNIILNYFLMPKIGLIGATIVTIIAQMFAAYIFDFYNIKTRKIFYMKTRAFNPAALIILISKGL